MEYDSIAGCAAPLPRLIQGTAMFREANEDDVFALLDGVYAHGCTAFDTAHIYHAGECERLLGRWVRSRGLRDRVVVIDKGAHPIEGRNRVTPDAIASDIEDSRERLGFETIDVYMLHRDDPAVPAGEIVQCLNDHADAGRIGAIGASNWTTARIAEANTYAEQNGLRPFTSSSVQFSLADQIKEPWPDCVSIGGDQGAEARAWYEAQQIPVLCWSSLAGGWLSGKLNPHKLRPHRRQLFYRCYKSDQNIALLERLTALAEETGYTVPQLALAYVLHHPMKTFALVGCETPEEFAANAKALDVPADIVKEFLP